MEHFSKALAWASRTAASAQELLRDKELRSKGIQTVVSGAQSRLQSLQNGIVQRAGQIGERLQDKQRQLQSLLASLEERLSSSQRAWQLQASRRLKVDVQFGRQLLADVPQEVRARLWYVLLENPHLAAPIKCQRCGPVPNLLLDDEGDRADSGDEGMATPGASGGGGGGGGNGRSASRLAAAAASAFGFGRNSSVGSSSGVAGGGGGGGSVHGSQSVHSLSRRDRSGVASPEASRHAAQQPARPGQDPMQGQSPGQAQSQSPGQAQGQGQYGPLATQSPGSSLGTPVQLGRTSRADAPDPFSGNEMDGWELIGGMVGPLGTDGVGMGPGGASAAAALAASHPEAVRILMERLEALGPLPLDESGSDPLLVAQQAVLEAMLQVPWEPGVGLPPEAAADCRFAMLNEMTAGQEEVDDSILRDIHRTFPEHPYFGMEAGQRSLFRVLKAYSLHDLEVAYCQGMAFMAGVLLMYVPEEMAFRLFCRLMDPEGPNLRRLYLPGLEPLKAELATFELLLSWRLPELARHLAAFGLPPVLYVSQWLMTLFATPFPPPFCARVIDVLLQDGHDRLLLRCSFAVMEALEGALLERHDFEALITYLKMEPVSWGLSRQRTIMDRALNSPITDAEIDVARETVASRQYLGASSLAAEGAAATAGQELLGSAAAAAGGGALAHLPTQVSFEHEVEAALAAAAATMAAAGDAADSDDGAPGGSGNAGLTGSEAAAGCRGAASRHGGPDMISFDEDAGVPGPGAAGGPGRTPFAPLHRSSGGGCGTGGTATASSSHAASGGGGGGGAGEGGGHPRSLLDDLDLDLMASASGPTRGSQPRPAPELEYGEYGEMLLDAGLLLPELGVAGEVPPASASAAAAVTAPGGRQQAGDLLLD